MERNCIPGFGGGYDALIPRLLGLGRANLMLQPVGWLQQFFWCITGLEITCSGLVILERVVNHMAKDYDMEAGVFQ